MVITRKRIIKAIKRFWYQDLPNRMQRKMLKKITSNRCRPRKVWYTLYTSDFDVPTTDDVLAEATSMWRNVELRNA